MFELVDSIPKNAEIKVVGVGGGGGNAVRHMMNSNIDGVHFICANTDAQSLNDLENATVLQLGGTLTKGLGAGANPEVGRQAALEDKERIAQVLEGADMVFITAGMGGGTGTGGAPVIAEVAKQMGILTVGVVTRPFSFEGRKRMAIADEGIAQLKERVDSLIIVPNEKLLQVLGKDMTVLNAFKQANDVLFGAVQGITDLILLDGLINVDFADVRTVMSEMGMAMMGTGEASGVDRAMVAAEGAIKCPLLEDINLQGAKGILVNITSGYDLTLGEFEDVGNTIREFADEDATIIVGSVFDPELEDQLRVTVVATGLRAPGAKTGPRGVVVDNQPPRKIGGDIDYNRLDKPTVNRRNTSIVSGDATARKIDAQPDPEMDYLDVPAFLRKQAD
ncbi:MAG: cell division protein FtsZ [Porticoccaceae bacterium]|jgi:cell division protein FtsZ|nr:cell division protein FtsZ [Porticoccaceae bacterium]MBT5576985.1 cell division protein FtsZ [Porticoccaceae bacterium]MBT7374329.1 cell division protein FtsZ [Porticoccaceae bacterium]